MKDAADLDKLHQANDLGIPEFTHKGGDPARRKVLEENYRMREGLDPGPRNFGSSDGFGRVALRIPEFDYPFIRAMFPDIGAPDATTRTKGWQAFCRSPLSEKYKVDRKSRGRNASRGLIRVT